MSKPGQGEDAGTDPGLATPSQASGPPEPPHIDRSINIPLPALASLVVLLLIVIAALLQLFDAARHTVTSSDARLSISVNYPSRLRASRDNYLRVDLTNQSGEAIENVTVSFDTTYFEGLSQVDFVPAASRPWVVEYPRLRPGERQRIHIGIEAKAYGEQPGSLTVTASGVATQRLEFSTLFIP